MKPFLFSISIFLFVTCRTQKQPEFVMPVGAPPEVMRTYEEQFKKGKALYKIHCAECHGIFTKGKADMPNFTDSQIHVYSVQVLSRSDNHDIMKKMSTEQFNYVLNYLRLRNTVVKPVKGTAAAK